MTLPSNVRQAAAQPTVKPAPLQDAVGRKKTSDPLDAVGMLSADHAEVDALFRHYLQLAATQAPAAERRTLADKICSALTVHATLEEEIFYPAARAGGVEADLLDEATVEHASAKSLIAQIEAMTADDRLFDATVAVLGEYVTHHVEEEEGSLFPQCRAAGLDLRALVAPMAARRVELTAAVDPAGEGDSGDNFVTRLASKALDVLKPTR